MKILVLGGTNFVGRHIVEALLGAGHQISILTRGKTNPHLFPEATHLVGDRDGDISAARGSWDACVDVSGYTTAQVERCLELLADSVGRYLFISTVSVYKAPAPQPFDESAPVEEVTDSYAPLKPETYGMLKVSCEETIEARLGDRSLIFRLGLVSGPHDPTDRATYWMLRAAEGGEVFVPAPADTPFQVVDARDIGAAVVRGLEAQLTGRFNLVHQPTTWGEWLKISRQVALELGAADRGDTATGDADFIFVDDQGWVEQKAAALTETRPRGALPMYLPAAYGWNFWRVSNDRARAAGISFRPYAQTIRDTLAWRLTLETEPAAGLTGPQERRLIEEWRGRG